VLKASKRIAYGAGAFQFGICGCLMTKSSVHGLWSFSFTEVVKSEYDLGYAGYLCAALAREGIACCRWNTAA